MGHTSYIAFGRGKRPSQSKLIKIGNLWSVYMHGFKTMVFDKHGLGSKNATNKLIEKIRDIKPDLIGLHNLHGYYINIEILFNYLRTTNIQVVWTLFDCWSFTGHCTYFDDIDCQKWIKSCSDCPKTKKYPSSYFLDNSFSNYNLKKALYSDLKNLSLVVHSKWLKDLVSFSFLKDLPTYHIASGIDLNMFAPVDNHAEANKKYGLDGSKVILGVANIWDKRKGLQDFITLSSELAGDVKILLIGLNRKQMKDLPKNIIGIQRTENVQELVELYSRADVFVNPTFQDNFPTTNLESIACGTPVITYNTGGSPEAIDATTGIVVPKGDINGLYVAIQEVFSRGKLFYASACRERAERLFNKDDRFGDYLKLYEFLLKKDFQNPVAR